MELLDCMSLGCTNVPTNFFSHFKEFFSGQETNRNPIFNSASGEQISVKREII
jgi:hypothetical protein